VILGGGLALAIAAYFFVNNVSLGVYAMAVSQDNYREAITALTHFGLREIARLTAKSRPR
jgi:hypothetical protein